MYVITFFASVKSILFHGICEHICFMVLWLESRPQFSWTAVLSWDHIHLTSQAMNWWWGVFFCFAIEIFNKTFALFCVSFAIQGSLWKLKFTVDSFWGHSFSSQWLHKMSSHCELAVSFWLVCNSHGKLAVSSLWDHPVDLTMQWKRRAHCELVSCELTVLAICDLTVIRHVEIFRWALCEHGISSHLLWVTL